MLKMANIDYKHAESDLNKRKFLGFYVYVHVNETKTTLPHPYLDHIVVKIGAPFCKASVKP
jgi:hypothetical protein